MKFRGRSRGRASEVELDARLAGIFDDRLTPGAPETLYSYLREVPMTTPTEAGAGGPRGFWRSIGLTGRTAVALAAALVVVLGAAAVVVLPRTLDSAAGSSPTPNPVPSYPPAPSGWHFVFGLGSADPPGIWSTTNLIEPSSHIAIHVVCRGVGSLIVLAGPNSEPGFDGAPAQAVVFACSPDGQETRTELTSSGPGFHNLSMVMVDSPSSLVSGSYSVSVEVPDAAPAPTASASPAQ